MDQISKVENDQGGKAISEKKLVQMLDYWEDSDNVYEYLGICDDEKEQLCSELQNLRDVLIKKFENAFDRELFSLAQASSELDQATQGLYSAIDTLVVRVKHRMSDKTDK